MALTNAEKWNILHSDPKYCPKYPSERVVQWMSHLKKGKILDHGCGTGRHSVMFSENGFDVCGYDISENGIKNALPGNIQYDCGSGLFLPYKFEEFDYFLSYGVLYYLSQEGIKKIIEELYCVLKSGGQGMVVVRTTNDSRYHGNIGRGDDDMPMEFFTKKKIRNLFSKFLITGIDKQRQIYGNEIDEDFIIYLTKP